MGNVRWTPSFLRQFIENEWKNGSVIFELDNIGKKKRYCKNMKILRYILW